MSKHAILIIDMLNDFADPKGALYCPNNRKIIPTLQKLIEWVRNRNAQGNDDVRLIFIQEAHRVGDADFKVRPVHSIKGTWGSEFIEELLPEDGEYIVQKRRHSAFAHTDLDLYLREEHIDTVVVTGTWTNVCVRSSASDALYYAYKVVTLSDACQSKTDELHENGLKDLSIFTKVMTVDDYINSWEEGYDPWEGAGDVANKVK